MQIRLYFVLDKKQLSPAMMVPMVIPYIAIPLATLLMSAEFLEIMLKKKDDIISAKRGRRGERHVQRPDL